MESHDLYGLGFRFEVDEDRGTFRVSWDGGNSWSERRLYNDWTTVEVHQRGRFYVKQVLKPELAEGESLCIVCANRGEVGIVRYAGRASGRETFTVQKYDDDGGDPYTEDESRYCEYAQWKCTSCGDLADSEYA